MRRCARRSWVFKKKVFEYKGREIRKGADLSGADLSGLIGREVLAALGSLKGLNFANANLTNANFDGLELQEVNFAGANLSGASFAKCWFPQGYSDEPVGFSGATLTNATITTAYEFVLTTRTSNRPEWWSFNSKKPFTGANLDGATLGGCFEHFEFANASLRGARFSRGTYFSECNFVGVDMRGARFSRGTHFYKCNFVGADMSGSHFEGDQDFKRYEQLEDRPCTFLDSKMHGATLLDVTGCAYLYMTASPLPEIKVADGTFYVDCEHVGNALSLYKIFRYEPHPQSPGIDGPWYIALTRRGFVRESSAEVGSSSGVESKLAEVRQLLDDGLIDQAEHDALRRKILEV